MKSPQNLWVMSMTKENNTTVDPDTHNRRRRLSSIQDARERVQEVVNESYGAYARNEINEFGALTQIRRAVEMYIYEVEGLVKSEEEHESHYWESCEIGQMELPTTVMEFRGLESIINAPNTITDQWEETVVCDVNGKDTETVAVQRQISYDVLMSAYSTVNQFCAQAGLDLNTDTARDAEFDYEDLLQEGPPHE